MKKHEKTGLLYRENTLDNLIINEGNREEYALLWPYCKDQVVLDIGGFIGDSSYYALKAGAKQVISIEPDQENLKIYKLQDHYNDPRLIVLEQAVSDTDSESDLFVNDTTPNKGTPTLRKTRGRSKIKVSTISFSSLIKQYNPTILKIDCEGGEIYFDYNLPNVIALSMELHLGIIGEEKSNYILNSIKQNFEIEFFKEYKSFNKIQTQVLFARKK
jgi:FkbM family methyltransferase